MEQIRSLAGEIDDLYQSRGARRYGLESISQLQHALQCAALAQLAGESHALVLAALLHDVGHMIHQMGENPAAEGRDDHHERLGAKWLAARLSAAVSEPVRLHVAAKRYLCAVDPDYAGALAPDSVLSLTLQGGPMSADECARFLNEPFAQDAIRLRRYDEAAKDAKAVTPPLQHFLRLLPD